MLVRYDRPKKFSNPDYDYTLEEIESIIRKSNSELTCVDFICIFGTPITIGTYQECAGFLPIVINRLENAPDDDFPSTVYPDLLSWINFYADKLQNDGLFEELKAFVTAEMRNVLDDYQLAEKNDYPVNIGILDTLFDGLNENSCFDFLGDKLFEERIGSSITFATAAWSLELLENYYCNSYESSQFLCKLSKNEELKSYLANIVLSAVIEKNNEHLMQHWERILTRCGLI